MVLAAPPAPLARCQKTAEELADYLREKRRTINHLEIEFALAASALAAAGDATQVVRDGDAVQWLRDECRMTSHAARTAINVGENQAVLKRSVDAVIDGSIGMAHLGWMADTAERLATSSSAESRFDEDTLLAKAKRLSVQRFRRECRHVIHAADHEAFVCEQVREVQARRMRLTAFDDGAVHIDAFLDAEGGAIVRAAIEPFARRSGTEDHRDLSHRRGDALVEVCNHMLDSGAVPRHGGQRPHIQVTTTLETLLDIAGAPAAVTESGAMLSGTTIDRLACDSTLVRVLVNTEAMPIDVGRATRIVPPSTRRALAARDGGCVWPGCGRTASWTQAHHLIHWAVGGRTDLNNLVLLCHRHHWMVHEGGFVIARAGDGEVLTFAPAFDQFPSGRDPTSVRN